MSTPPSIRRAWSTRTWRLWRWPGRYRALIALEQVVDRLTVRWP
jgi:hypothetical protein